MKKLTTFKKGLLIYGLVWLVIMLGIWFVAWNYAAAYEMAQPVGAIDAYVEQTLKQERPILLQLLHRHLWLVWLK